MITDKYPSCGKEYQWNAEQDCYIGTEETFIEESTSHVRGWSVTLFKCNCGGVVGVEVHHTDVGSSLYTPSTKEL